MSFKQFYYSNMIKESALAGHLTHPYEVLTKIELFSFFDELLSGKLEASEKVDGANLFVGFNDAGKLTFARNLSEQPSTDIEKKFPVSHPGGDAFRAGFKALQQGFEKLSRDERIKAGLIGLDGSPKSFVNLEIIYGEIPNLIQYSSIDNYIIFHSMVGTYATKYAPLNEAAKESQKKGLGLTYKGWGIYQNRSGDSFEWVERTKKFMKKIGSPVLSTIKERLQFLANTIKQESVVSDVVTYYGDIGSVKTDIKKSKSNWIFKSQIIVSNDKIRQELSKIAQEWRHFPEFKQLQKSNITSEEEFELKKSLTAKIGAKILINLSSELFKGDRKTGPKHPKIEGLVVPFNNALVKITGDFAQINQDLWKPLNDGLNMILLDTVQKISKEELDVNIDKKMTKVSWNAKGINGDPKLFLLKKNKTTYSDPAAFTQKINISRINKHINDAYIKLQQEYEKMSTDEKNIKKMDILKALRIGGYKLQELSRAVSTIDDRVSLLMAIKHIMFGI